MRGIRFRIVKAGEESGQGVGYLEDGTMVVIEGGRDHIASEVMAVVTSVLQTRVRMVFGPLQLASPRLPTGPLGRSRSVMTELPPRRMRGFATCSPRRLRRSAHTADCRNHVGLANDL